MDKKIAVIDIGMTNKKVAIYDGKLGLVALRKKIFEPKLAGGIEAHDLAGMESWFLETLRDLSRKFDIGAIAVTTHGATFVCADAAGNSVAPCLFYTHEPGAEFQKRFYDMAGDPRDLQAATGTPNFSALINPAKGLFFLKELCPAEFASASLVLPYPQYWGMRLTGKAGVEGTFIGCHTYLYDWKRGGYSSVAEKLGIAGKLPFPLKDSWEILGTITPEVTAATGLKPDTVVTMGIHDSNASLLPYLVKDSGTDFVVNSTGTWCVLMHPQEEFRFSPDELGKVVFFNRSAYNKPVKTAIFLGGKEYEVWTALFRAAAAQSAPPAPAAAPSPALYARILAERSAFILPEIVPGSGQFPGSIPQAIEAGRRYKLADIEAGRARPAFMDDPAAAEAVLNLSLALQTMVALERAGLAPGQTIFTEGGFRNNRDYNAILAAALPSNPVYLTDMSEATSFGAALTGLAALEKTTPSALGGLFSIARIPAEPMPGLADFAAYREKWLALIAETR
jgi:sugar (pentulose or hexulose) kinase